MDGRSRRITLARRIARAAFSSRRASPSSSINSHNAPSALAPSWHSRNRSSGVPWLADSPREQTTTWAGRPARVSNATTPPQPNSTSSGWEPKATSGAGSGWGFNIGFIGPLDRVADDVSDLGRVVLPEVVLLAGARHVVRAANHRLHPAQPRIARRADPIAGVREIREVHVLVAPFVQLEPAFQEPRPHDLALVRHIDVVILHVACRETE